MSSEIKVVEKSKKLINSFKYAIQGILSSFKTERYEDTYIYNDFSYYCRSYTKNK